MLSAWPVFRYSALSMQTSTSTSAPVQSAHPHQAARRQTVVFSGRVQGVGFRYTSRNVVLKYDVCGYVRNLPNGSVELNMEGPEQEMDRVVEEIRRKMSAFIRGVAMQSAPATGEFDQFSIRH